MEVVQRTSSELFKGLAIAIVLSRFLSPRSALKHGQNPQSTWQTKLAIEFIKVAGLLSVFIFGRSWLALVSHEAPEPYLVSESLNSPEVYEMVAKYQQDEVFHIPQAQTYCEGRYWDWDDKITTPPGLYLLSVAYHKLWMLSTCTPFSLRSNNLLAILLTALLAALCRDDIEARTAEQNEASDNTTKRSHPPQPFSFYTYHTALNIALFPVLFFFSGLYYTDVVSTLAVLVAYKNHLGRVGTQRPGLINDLWTVFLGVATLFMRQTNVFWVVVYMGGLEAVHAVRSLKPEPEEWPRFTTLSEQIRFYILRWAVGGIDDPPLDVSWPDDWLLCLLSIAVAAVCNPVRVLKQVWPHITVLGLFAGFVAWNGGVVLGDKSNHVATIHLAQMLYIWPFFAFFSAPLLLPTILELLQTPLTTIFTLVCGKRRSNTPTKSSLPAPPKPLTLQATNLISVNKIYYPFYLLSTILFSIAIVKFNTIIHPFTLADNRHYMFYIFRYTIRRSIKMRYLLVGAYTLSRWLVWKRLAGNTTAKPPSPLKNKNTKSKTKTTNPSNGLGTLNEPNSTSSASPPTSTILLWLLTTSLSLITAPLVEPRYFILPWVFFRLLVPAWQVPLPESSAPATSLNITPKSPLTHLHKAITTLGRKIDLTLAVETLWFIAINLGTMYMFLYRPFYWRDNSGDLLDGGRLQRFMW